MAEREGGTTGMTELSGGSAYENVIRTSEPRRIGKHAWRLVQYRGTELRFVGDKTGGKGRYVETPTVFVDYEWRRLDEPFEYWRQARDWPRYDFNNGQTRGLPVTLRKLYDACPWAHPSHEDDDGPPKEAAQ